MLAAVTLLPALMSLAGTHINSLALPARLHPSDDPDKRGVWGVWSGSSFAARTCRWRFAALILVPLIIPTLSLQLGQENVGQTDPRRWSGRPTT